ncbi:MAG TPA: methyltransferase domain-containing protein [Candidatus Nanopelagicaceae bacterium]|nr:methyltransferase domain-containing protein [Candidatus Nanopelagicaceae bacterium]
MKPLSKDSDKKKNIVAKYDSTSSFYDDRYRNIQNSKFKLLLRDFKFDNKIILDAGCGTGLLFEFFLRSYQQIHNRKLRYIGLDISWKMLKQFLYKINKVKNIKFVNLILGDIENLPFREETIHQIFAVTSLQNLYNIERGLRELFRIGQQGTSLNLSILRKNLNLNKIYSYLKTEIIDLNLIRLEKVEDVIIQGNLLKKK